MLNEQKETSVTQQHYTLNGQTFYLVPPQGGQWIMDGNQRRVFSGPVIVDANGYLTDTEGNFLFSEEKNGYVTAAEVELKAVNAGNDNLVAENNETPTEMSAESVETAEPTEAPAEPAEQIAEETNSADGNEMPVGGTTDAPTMAQTAIVPPVTAPPVPQASVAPPVATTPPTAPTSAAPAYAPQSTQVVAQPPMQAQVQHASTDTPDKSEKKSGVSLPLSIVIILLTAAAGVGAGWLLFHFLG